MSETEPSQMFSDDEFAPLVGLPDAVLEHAEALLNELRDDLSNVEAAIARLENGTYGKCDVCAGEVEAQRLAEDPTAHRCSVHEASSSVAPSS